MRSKVSFEGDDVIVEVWIFIYQIIDEHDILVRDHEGRGYRVRLPRTARLGTRLRLKNQGLSRGQGVNGDLYVVLRDARKGPDAEIRVLDDEPLEVDPFTAKCSYCGGHLIEAKMVLCPRCLTLCHKDCWDANGRRCVRFGCVP